MQVIGTTITIGLLWEDSSQDGEAATSPFDFTGWVAVISLSLLSV